MDLLQIFFAKVAKFIHLSDNANCNVHFLVAFDTKPFVEVEEQATATVATLLFFTCNLLTSAISSCV